MIYSRWRPDTGGYDYFETSERVALADDLPTPSLLGGSPIGIPSVKCGRPLPSGAQPVGSGRQAKGVITPIDRTGLSGLDALGVPLWGWALGLAAGAFAFFKLKVVK